MQTPLIHEPVVKLRAHALKDTISLNVAIATGDFAQQALRLRDLLFQHNLGAIESSFEGTHWTRVDGTEIEATAVTIRVTKNVASIIGWPAVGFVDRAESEGYPLPVLEQALKELSKGVAHAA